MADGIRIQVDGAEEIQDEIEHMAAVTFQIGDVSMRAGIFGKNASVTHPRSKAPYSLIALTNEFGKPEKNIPPRPVFGPVMQRNQAKYADEIAASLEGLYQFRGAGGTFIARVDLFDSVGRKMVADLRAGIEAGPAPGNKPRTILRKGFDHPLKETGRYPGLIDFEIITA